MAEAEALAQVYDERQAEFQAAREAAALLEAPLTGVELESVEEGLNEIAEIEEAITANAEQRAREKDEKARKEEAAEEDAREQQTAEELLEEIADDVQDVLRRELAEAVSKQKRASLDLVDLQTQIAAIRTAFADAQSAEAAAREDTQGSMAAAAAAQEAELQAETLVASAGIALEDAKKARAMFVTEEKQKEQLKLASAQVPMLIEEDVEEAVEVSTEIVLA